MEELTTMQDWERVLTDSDTHPSVIFKHSTRCPISSGALQRINAFLAARAQNDPPFYLVKVVESRSVSNAVADTLHVEHKSPQVILLNKRQAVWSASHYGITEDNLRDAIAGV